MCCDSHNRVGNPGINKMEMPTPPDGQPVDRLLGRDEAAQMLDQALITRGLLLSTGQTGQFLENELASNEEERCKCRGVSIQMLTDQDHGYRFSLADAEAQVDSMGCRCARKITGEDLRCTICRYWCSPDMTPRVMSEAALKGAKNVLR